MKNKPISELKNDSKLITMTNALTRAGCSLTLGEKRIVMLAVSKLNPLKKIPIQTFTTKITAAEYAESYNLDTNTAYTQLKSAAKTLYNRTLTFYEPAYKRDSKTIKPVRIDMHWVGRATYHEGEGWIELAWWYELLPHLMGIKKQFTEYQLSQATALRSIYSWRLLELLMRFKSTGWAEYTIEDFATSMQATEKQRSDFGNIKRRMIEPAVKELIEKDGWVIEWHPITAGRKVKAVRFEFSRPADDKVLKNLDWINEDITNINQALTPKSLPPENQESLNKTALESIKEMKAALLKAKV